MRVHRYWATADFETADAQPRSLRRGSDISHEDALALAQQAAQEQASRSSEALDWYDYVDTGRAEPIVEEVLDEQGQRAGAVTVNRDGILVLNTRSLVFVDVDLPATVPRKSGGLLGRLFGKKSEAPPPSDPRGDALGALAMWIDEDRSRGAHVYETAAGLRYLLTAPSLDPTAPESDALMERLRADPLYRTLCRAQACYRARLTPKPWRVPGAPRTHLYAPGPNGEPHPAYRDFKPAYEEACVGYATCALIDRVGDTNPRAHEDAVLIALHDEHTRADSGLPLA